MKICNSFDKLISFICVYYVYYVSTCLQPHLMVMIFDNDISLSSSIIGAVIVGVDSLVGSLSPCHSLYVGSASLVVSVRGSQHDLFDHSALVRPAFVSKEVHFPPCLLLRDAYFILDFLKTYRCFIYYLFSVAS